MADNTATREVITNMRHAATGRVFKFTWKAAYGMTAAAATDALRGAGLAGKIAAALGVPEAQVEFAVTRGTSLTEGVIKLASDAKAKAAAKPGATRGKTDPAVNPETRAREIALAYVVEHPQTTFAKALKLAQVQVAREAVEAKVAEYDRELAELRERIEAVEALKREAVGSLKAARAASK